jgi:predicted phage gp36 major capsid-like protein
LSALDELKTSLEEELKQVKRPGGGTQSKVAGEHKTAFITFMRKGNDDGLRDLERKALQVGVDEDGGFAVPEELDRAILDLLKDEVVMRQEATTITVGGANYKKLVNLGGSASGWVGETDPRPATDASKLGQIEPFMGKSTATRKPLKRCWMTHSSMLKTGSTANWRLSLQSRKRSPSPAVTGTRNQKVFWPMPHHWMMIKPAHSALFSTFSQALLLV